MCVLGSSPTGEEAEVTRSHCVDLPTIYQQSAEHKQLKSMIDPILHSLQEEQKSAGRFLNGKTARVNYATNFFWQVLANAHHDWLFSVHHSVNFIGLSHIYSITILTSDLQNVHTKNKH